ncbi:MAG: beta-ketoacyl-ACP synthase III, partial [Alphaproteobacteria bacterium]|nr:beta-ketoacyl-ACP synthase III [Alphaproteobacteria bacterium]
MRVAISGTGLFTPSAKITNAELVAAYNEFVRRHNEAHRAEIEAGTMHALLKSSDEFIFKASGIKSRYVMAKDGMLDPEVMCPRLKQRTNEELSYSAEIGLAAAHAALKAADRKPSDIDAVIVSASIMERPYPQIAIEIQQALGIEGLGYDMLAGCSSATFGIQNAVGLVATGAARAVLCINPEVCTSHLNLRDRETHCIFGDAATACVVERADAAVSANRWEVVGTRLKSVYSNNIRNNFGPMNRFEPETMGLPDKLITQKGRKVFKEVVPMVAGFMLEHLAQLGITPSHLKRLWLHQANINMNDLIARKVLGRDPTPEEAPNVLHEYGNTSSAGAVIAFHKFSADLAPGDLGHLCSFGAGYTAGSVVLKKL